MKRAATMLSKVENYLAFRRQLGFKLDRPAEELRSLARYAEHTGHRGPLTTDLVVRWATLRMNAKPGCWATRLQSARPFAQYLAGEDPRTEVPAPDLLGPRYPRGQPYIYSTAEIAALLRATRTLRRWLRPHTYEALFGLLAATGLRVGEALRLKCGHVDLDTGVLNIVKSKASQCRLVPLHPSSAAALQAYVAVRERLHPTTKSDAFFLSDIGTTLRYPSVIKTFWELRRALGWRAPPGGRAPRIHDLRHTFVVRALLRWYEAGANVDEKMAALCTYLGHVNPTSTYWYLTAVPELMAITGRRFEQYAHQGGIR